MAIRRESGADSVLFFGGYSKWFRPWLHRLAYSFGTQNYATESSTCFTSGLMAWKVATGKARPGRHGALRGVSGMGLQPLPLPVFKRKARGRGQGQRRQVYHCGSPGDPGHGEASGHPPAPVGGTDGALALGMANILIENGWIDKEYIEKYVSGFEAFAEYVKRFNADNLEAITGVPYDQAVAACRMIHENGRCPSTSPARRWLTTRTGCRITGRSWP